MVKIFLFNSSLNSLQRREINIRRRGRPRKIRRHYIKPDVPHAKKRQKTKRKIYMKVYMEAYRKRQKEVINKIPIFLGCLFKLKKELS